MEARHEKKDFQHQCVHLTNSVHHVQHLSTSVLLSTSVGTRTMQQVQMAFALQLTAAVQVIHDLQNHSVKCHAMLDE